MKFTINVKSISLNNEVNAQRSKRVHFQPASTKTQMPEVEKIICVATAHTHKINQTNKNRGLILNQHLCLQVIQRNNHSIM